MSRLVISSVASIALMITFLLHAVVARAQGYRGEILYQPQTPSTFVNGPHVVHEQGGQVVGRGQSTTSGIFGPISHASLSTLPSGFTVNLHPMHLQPTESSSAIATNGVQQVGAVGGYVVAPHAFLWSGSAASATDLHPTNLGNYEWSVAQGLSATRQFGFGGGEATGFRDRALMWSGTAASAVDLHPTHLAGFNTSQALGGDEFEQVGFGNYESMNGFSNHALLWRGTAASAIDLTPTNLIGYDRTEAVAAAGGQQVGGGSGSGTQGQSHALLWFGTADSAVNLNHPSLRSSWALDTNGRQQVGYGAAPSVGWSHALLWSGSADSMINLHTLLPAEFTGSRASSIDPDGTVWGIAVDVFGYGYAAKWTPVPEPASALLLSSAIVGILVTRRTRRRSL